jgi:hypothetical protein
MESSNSSFSLFELEHLFRNALHLTNEMPYNCIKRHVEKNSRNRVESAEFQKFNIRREFPHNVVFLRDGKILVCSEISSTYSSGIFLSGRPVVNVKEVYEGSAEVGFLRGSGLSDCKITVNASEVKAKSIPLPALPDSFLFTEEKLRKPAGALSFDNNREWYFVNMIE